MNVAIKVKDDGGQLRAEASVNAGKVFESLGKSALMLLVRQQEESIRNVMSLSNNSRKLTLGGPGLTWNNSISLNGTFVSYDENIIAFACGAVVAAPNDCHSAVPTE